MSEGNVSDMSENELVQCDQKGPSFETTLNVPMEIFLRHVPLSHLEARGISFVSDSAKVESKANIFRNATGWKDALVKALGEQAPELPCSKFIQFRGSRVGPPVIRKKNSKVWCSRAYCKKQAESLKEGEKGCLLFDFTLFDFDHTKDFVQIFVESTKGSKVLRGDDGLPSLEWHCGFKPKWEQAVLEELTVELQSKKAGPVLRDYIVRHHNDPENVPPPGPFKTLQNIRTKFNKVGENSRVEIEDLNLEIKKSPSDLLLNSEYPQFQVAWSAECQLSLLKSCDRETAYLDTTGDFLHNAPPVVEDQPEQPVFYGALVVKPDRGRNSVPVSEMLTTSQSSPTFASWLMNLRYRCSKSWSATGRLFKTVVVDDSWALIHAVLISFNHEGIISYLNRCWELESSNGEVEDDAFPSLTVLHICATHAIRRVRTYVKETGKPDHVRRLAERAYRALLRTDKLSDAKKVVSLIGKVFGCPKQSPDVDRAVAELERLQQEHVQRVARAKGEPVVEDIDEPTPQEGPIPQRELERAVEETLMGGNSLYQQSPYHTFFHRVIEEARRDVQVSAGINEYFIDGFLHYLEVQHLAYLPLMTRTFVRKEVDDHSHLLTNNPAEKWFDVVKNNLFKGSTNIRRAQVLRGLKQYVKGDLLLRENYPLPRQPRLHRRPPNKLRGLSSKGRGRGATRGRGTSRARGTSQGRGRARRSRAAPVVLQGELLPPTADPSSEVDTWGGYQEPSLPSYEEENGTELLQALSSGQIEPEENQALSSEETGPELIQEVQNFISDLLVLWEQDNKSLEARFKEIEQMKYKPLSEILTVAEVTADKKKRVQEIIQELNAPPQRMTIAMEERHRLRKLAEVLLNTIKTEECFLWLKDIVSGKLICDRHKFFDGRLKLGSTGQGPFATFQDLREKLSEYVEDKIISRIEPESVDKWQGEKEKAVPSVIYDQLKSFQYMHGVLIPEAIKYAFRAVAECSEEVAERLYSKTSETIYFRR